MRSSSPGATRFARLARAAFTSTLPPSMAAAACARVLKKRAAQSQVSRRAVSLAMALQCNASGAGLDLHAPLPVPDLPHDVIPLEPRRPDRDAAQLDAAAPRLDVDVRPELRHRSEEHTSELQSLAYLVCRLLLEKKKHDILHTIP